MQKVVLASSNPKKLKELESLLAPLQITLLPQTTFVATTIEETGLSFVENALLKARWASKHAGLPAIADDSGLVVKALHDAPGLFSARYAGKEATDAQNIDKLLKALKDVSDDQRHAYFYCAIVLLRHEFDPTPIIATGRWDGQILLEPRGTNGFGYDPVFWVESQQKSSAELSKELKNTLSHRGKAITELLEKISTTIW